MTNRNTEHQCLVLIAALSDLLENRNLTDATADTALMLLSRFIRLSQATADGTETPAEAVRRIGGNR